MYNILESTPKKRPYFICSDLHLEFWKGKEREYWEKFPKTEAKVCLCAGDLTVFGQPDAVVYRHFTELCNRFEKLFFVLGNHEYYGTCPEDVQKRLAAIENALSPVLTVLRTGTPYIYDGQRFIGDTMWFPDRPEVHIYRNMINDYAQIKGLFPWCFTQSNLFMEWIKSNLLEDDIVITHHIPTDIATLPQWKGSQTQSYFLNSDCEKYLQDPNSVLPKAWIYGHTHDYHSYSIGRTRFICNPLGYPSENKNLLSRQFVYEL